MQIPHDKYINNSTTFMIVDVRSSACHFFLLLLVVFVTLLTSAVCLELDSHMKAFMKRSI